MLWRQIDIRPHTQYLHWSEDNAIVVVLAFQPDVLPRGQSFAILAGRKPPTVHWRGAFSSRHPPACGCEIVGVDTRQADKFIAVDVARITFNKKSDVWVMQALICHGGHSIAQGCCTL